MKLTGIKIDSRLFHLNSCLPFPKNTPAFYENTPAFEVPPKSWTKNWGAHYEVQKTWY